MIHFLILSDIHYSISSKGSKMIMDRAKKMANAVYGLLNKDINKLIVVVNGDIANEGLKAEFTEMQSFFSLFEDELYSKASTLEIKYIFIPGNHDCDFRVYNEDQRKTMIQRLNSSDFDIYLTDDYRLKLENFFNFIGNYESLEIIGSSEYYTKYKVNNTGHNIDLLTFNSIMFFDYTYNRDRMIIDDSVLEQADLTDDSIIISFTHYPLEWYKREDTDFHNNLLKKSDLVFMSHEHKLNRQIIIAKNGHQTFDFRLPAFFDKHDSMKSGFLFLKIDEITSVFSIKEYYLTNGIYIKDVNDLQTNIKRTLRPNGALIPIDQDQYDFFMKSDFILINYSLKCIDDLFVSPMIGIPYIDENDKDYYEYFEIEQFNPYENDKSTFFIFTDSFGKTTLLKHLFRDIFHTGYIPIYVSIDSNNNTIERIERSIETFIKLYFQNYDLVMQNKDHIILLIDQISFLKHNTINIIDALKNRGYYKIISTFDEKEHRFDSIDWNYSDIERYTVFKFGHKQKYDLIEKWVEISKFKDLDIAEKNQKIASIKELIDKSDRRLNFINTPSMILIFLDAYEDNRSDTLLINGSKGVFYKFLFNKYIYNIATNSSVELPFVERFLQYYAYYRFKQPNLSFTDFSNIFIDEQMITPEYYYNCITKIKKSLMNLSLINDDREGTFDLSFKQFHAYLVAQYYVMSIDDLQDEIKSLTDTLFDDDIANIVLFIVNSNQSKFIIDRIVDITNKLFESHPEAQCESDIEFLNVFISGIPDDIKPFGEVKKNNKTLYKRLDALENQIKDKTEKQKKKEKTVFEKSNLTSNRARDIINEILSQMVKKEQTEKLIHSSIKMSLRKLSGLIKFFEEFITYGKVHINEFSDEDLYKFNETTKMTVIAFSASLYDVGENLSPNRYYDYVYSFLKSNYTSNVSHLLRNLLSLKINRQNDDSSYFNVLLNYREKMIKQKNFICALLINFALSNELNYIDIKDEKKRKLLDMIDSKKLSSNEKDPIKNMNQAKRNKEIRLDNIRKRRDR